MNVSKPFIHRPVATTLIMVAITLVGAIGYTMLPVAAIPQVDFPTVGVSASLPGASPEIMASSVATPLERQFGHIAGVTDRSYNEIVDGFVANIERFRRGEPLFNQSP